VLCCVVKCYFVLYHVVSRVACCVSWWTWHDFSCFDFSCLGKGIKKNLCLDLVDCRFVAGLEVCD